MHGVRDEKGLRAHVKYGEHVLISHRQARPYISRTETGELISHLSLYVHHVAQVT